MLSGTTSVKKLLAERGRVIAILLLILLSLSLQGCGSSTTKTYQVEQAVDCRGNTLIGCIDEVTELPNGSTEIVTKYKDYTVSGTTTKLSYDDWIQAGRPDNDKGYKYYYVYTPTGEDHALVYMNNEDACIEVVVPGRNGRRSCKLILSKDDVFLLKNPVTGNTVNTEVLEQDYQYYHEEASRIINAIDPDFLYSLDTQSNIPRSAKSNPSRQSSSDVSAPSNLPENAVDWLMAPQHVGETVSVYGPVVDSEYARTSNGQPTFLDLGTFYPDPDRVSVVIWGKNRGNFSPSPEALYEGKRICVTGEVYVYDGVCNIEATSPDQIKILD